eukprot:CAMPEP_0182421830 /NCGR_PEP_ID=MMETSP1167-20130531/7342_1 /TAXON_ID=2988 /ORGANISM="Mallomonas Sp, Strain CCMP3275" /LENGTH=496 /DNA_ID=CAMNT_0024599349 /DNA_START=277 /DNA_END=1767 /DNA_ORIENTATION=-
MEAGTIAAWKKQPGDTLSPGDILCEIETDKATVGFEVQDDGVLAQIIASVGVEMKCGAPIAVTVDDEDDYKEFLASGGAVATPAIPPTPPPSTVKTEPVLVSEFHGSHSPSASPVTGTPLPSLGPHFTPTGPPASLTDPSPQMPGGVEPVLVSEFHGSHSPLAHRVSIPSSVRLSPAARHMVQSDRLDISRVVGSSKGGLISKGDVILAVKSGLATKATVSQSPPPTTTPTPAPTLVTTTPPLSVSPSLPTPITTSTSVSVSPSGGYTDIPANKMRKIIAKRLTESKATVPHSYMSTSVEIDALMTYRAKLKKELNVAVSVNDIIIKAVALSLRDVKAANGAYSSPGKWVSGGAVDISVAVATPNGLITPIITDADKRGLLDINSKVKELAGRAKEGKLKPEEFQGGTFSISNLGMFGITEFSAVINNPQGCILAVGGGVPRVLPPSSSSLSLSPRVATLLSVTLSSDRRVLDESMQAQFMQALKMYIGNPGTLSL